MGKVQLGSKLDASLTGSTVTSNMANQRKTQILIENQETDTSLRNALAEQKHDRCISRFMMHVKTYFLR